VIGGGRCRPSDRNDFRQRANQLAPERRYPGHTLDTERTNQFWRKLLPRHGGFAQIARQQYRGRQFRAHTLFDLRQVAQSWCSAFGARGEIDIRLPNLAQRTRDSPRHAR